jgi:hypothetical protein
VPLTLAHPAAVLWLRRRLPLPALVAGALAPDLAYHLPVPGGGAAHALIGPVTIDLLLGGALLLAWYAVRAPLADLAPGVVRGAAPAPRRADLPRVAVAIVVGAATHVLWDLLTHLHSPLVQGWPVLRTRVAGPHELFNVIGYASSALGLAVVVVAVLRTPRGPAGRRLIGPRARALAVAAVVAAAVAGAVLGALDPVARASGYDLVRQVVLGATRGAALALACYVLAWRAAAVGRAGSSRCGPGPAGRGRTRPRRRPSGG